MTDSRGFEAAAAQPVKTASRWWNTVLGPGTGESEPMAHSRTECPSARQAPHSEQSDGRGNACWRTSPTDTLINKSAVESTKYALPVTPKTNNYQGGDRFEPLMVCRSEAPRLVQFQSNRDDYCVPGSVVVKEVGSYTSLPSFQEFSSGFARCGAVGSSSSPPLDDHWQRMARGDAQKFGQYSTYMTQQCAGLADMCFGSPVANISALGRHASPTPSVYAYSAPNPFHQRGPIADPDPLRRFSLPVQHLREVPQHFLRG